MHVLLNFRIFFWIFPFFLLQILNLHHSPGGSFFSLLFRWKDLSPSSFLQQRCDLVKMCDYNRKLKFILMHLEVRDCVSKQHRQYSGQPVVCICVVKWEHVYVWRAWLCAVLVSTRSCTLTLSYRADEVRVLGSKALLYSLTDPHLPSHLISCWARCV